MVHFNFIEIGTSDFNTEIEKASDETIGLSIEPLNEYLLRLPNKNKCQKINAAISNFNGFIDIYSISPENIAKYNIAEWIKGCNSVGKPHKTVEWYLSYHGLPSNLIEAKIVPVLTFTDIINKYNVTGCDYLKIDTEGHDCVIVNDIIDSFKKGEHSILPKKLLFETNELTSNVDIDNTINRLIDIGYTLIEKPDGSNALLELKS